MFRCFLLILWSLIMAYQPIQKPTWAGKPVSPRYYPRPGTGYQGPRGLRMLGNDPEPQHILPVFKQALQNVANQK